MLLPRRGPSWVPRPACGCRYSFSTSTSARTSTSTSEELYVYAAPPVYKETPRELESKWGNLGFSIRNINGHVRYTWSNGSWDSGVFVPAPYQLMHINAGALHYGVAVFEGVGAAAPPSLCRCPHIRIRSLSILDRRLVNECSSDRNRALQG
eukprot:COSAG05_NODE_1475_length_4782_cov_16.988682_5_plen_152_part_00